MHVPKIYPININGPKGTVSFKVFLWVPTKKIAVVRQLIKLNDIINKSLDIPKRTPHTIRNLISPYPIPPRDTNETRKSTQAEITKVSTKLKIITLIEVFCAYIWYFSCFFINHCDDQCDRNKKHIHNGICHSFF